MFNILIPGLLGLLLGLALLYLHPAWILGTFIILILTLVVLKKPEIALIIFLTITSTIFSEDDLPRLPIGVGQLYITDVILISLFALVILRISIKPSFEFIRTPLERPILF